VGFGVSEKIGHSLSPKKPKDWAKGIIKRVSNAESRIGLFANVTDR